MRTRKIFGLLIPLFQLILVLKLIELVRGEPVDPVTYVTSKLAAAISQTGDHYTPNPGYSASPRFLDGIRRHPKAQRKITRVPYWTTSSTLPPVTLMEQIISYDSNGTEIDRRNVSRRIESPEGEKPSCPTVIRFFFWKFCAPNIPFLKMLFPPEFADA